MGKYLTVLKRAVSNYGSHNGTSFAAAICYNVIFSIFPLALFLLGFLGFFIHSTSQRQSIINNLFSAAGGGVSKGALTTQVNAIAGGSAAVGIIGLIIAGWSASGVFSRVRTSMNVIWDSTKSRPLVQGKLLDLGMVIGTGLLILLSLIATGVLTAVQSFGGQIFGSSLGWFTHLLFALLYLIVPPAISFVAFSLIYWVVPHAKIRLKDVWLGALVAAVLFEIVQLGFAFYVANFGHYAKTYGALSSVIAFLFFVYISANIILFGGEVAKEHIDVESGVKEATDPQPQQKQTLVQQAEGLVKGLFVDSSPHHDTSLPYEPGRNQPTETSGTLVKNDQAHSEVKQFQRQSGQPTPAKGQKPGGRTNGRGVNSGGSNDRRDGRTGPPDGASKNRKPEAAARRPSGGANAKDSSRKADGRRGNDEQNKRWHGDPRRTRDPNADKHDNHLPLP